MPPPYQGTRGHADFIPLSDEETRTDRDFIKSLLHFQRHDGAIDFGDWAKAKEVLGKPVSDALRALQQGRSDVTDLALWTITVHELLLRDFQSTKPLWRLMARKARDYGVGFVATTPSCHSLRVMVLAALDGMKLPVHQQQRETKVDGVFESVTSDQTTPELPAENDDKKPLENRAEDELQQLSQRVLRDQVAEIPSDGSDPKWEEGW